MLALVEGEREGEPLEVAHGELVPDAHCDNEGESVGEGVAHAEALGDAVVLELSDAVLQPLELGEGDGLGEVDALPDLEELPHGEALSDALALADLNGEVLAVTQALLHALPLPLGLCDTDAEAHSEGDAQGEGEPLEVRVPQLDGVAELHALVDAETLSEALPDADALRDADADALGDAERLGELDAADSVARNDTAVMEGGPLASLLGERLAVHDCDCECRVTVAPPDGDDTRDAARVTTGVRVDECEKRVCVPVKEDDAVDVSLCDALKQGASDAVGALRDRAEETLGEGKPEGDAKDADAWADKLGAAPAVATGAPLDWGAAEDDVSGDWLSDAEWLGELEGVGVATAELVAMGGAVADGGVGPHAITSPPLEPKTTCPPASMEGELTTAPAVCTRKSRAPVEALSAYKAPS